MSNSLSDKLKRGRRKDLAPRAVKRLKLRTVNNPTDADAWYELALYFFDLQNNQSAWKCLTNAKKLGSVDAITKIEEVLKGFTKTNANGQKALNALMA